MAVTTLSRKAISDGGDLFVLRFLDAMKEDRVNDGDRDLFDVFIGSGRTRRTPQRPSLDQLDGGHEKW